MLLLASRCCFLVSETLLGQNDAAELRPSGEGDYFRAMVREVKTRVREIRVDQLAALRAATPPPIVIDVREDHEWIKSRIPAPTCCPWRAAARRIKPPAYCSTSRPPSSGGRCESVRTWGLGRRGPTRLDISMHPAEGVRDWLPRWKQWGGLRSAFSHVRVVTGNLHQRIPGFQVKATYRFRTAAWS